MKISKKILSLLLTLSLMFSSLSISYANLTQQPTPTSATFTATSDNKGTLGGVDDTMKYSTDNGITFQDVSSGQTTVTDLQVKEHNGILVVKKGDEITTSDSDPQVVQVLREAKPSGIVAEHLTAASNDGKLKNITTAMEYKKTDAVGWTDGTGSDIENLAHGFYQIRVKANANKLSSEPIIIAVENFETLPRETTPSATFTAKDSNKGDLTSVDTTMKYSLNGIDYEDITTSAPFEVTIPSAPVTLYIVKKGNPATPTGDSLSQEINITKAGTPTGLTAVAPLSNANNDGKITGVDNTMEYKKSSETAWQAVTGTEITNLTPETYDVRVKASGAVLASDNATVTVDPFSAPVLPKEPTPNATFIAEDHINGKITGVDVTMKYSINGDPWLSFTENELELGIPSVPFEIKIKKPGNGTTTSDSDEQMINITKAATPTGLTAVAPLSNANNDGKITGVDNTMEYKKSSETAWQAVTGTEITNLTPETYDVRVKASGAVLASDNATVTVNPFIAPATHSITLSQTTPLNFAAQNVGYSAVAPETITVTNTGTASTGALDVTLSGANASSFELSSNTVSDIAVSGTGTFTVKPIDTLTAGTYNATVSVGNSDVTAQTFDVSFTVNPAAPPAGGGSSSSNHYSSVRPDPVGKVTTPNNDTTSTLKGGASKLSIGSTEIQTMKDGKISTVVMDAAPFISNGRTMVPLRYVAELLGLKVEWLPETKTAKLSDDKNEILVPLNSMTMKVNGKDVESDILPILKDSRTYMSISNIGKALGLAEGKNILWNNDTKEVTIIK